MKEKYSNTEKEKNIEKNFWTCFCPVHPVVHLHVTSKFILVND